MKVKDYKVGDLIETKDEENKSYYWIVLFVETSTPSRMLKRHKPAGNRMTWERREKARKARKLTFLRMQKAFCPNGTTFNKLALATDDFRKIVTPYLMEDTLGKQTCYGWFNKSRGE